MSSRQRISIALAHSVSPCVICGCNTGARRRGNDFDAGLADRAGLDPGGIPTRQRALRDVRPALLHEPLLQRTSTYPFHAMRAAVLQRYSAQRAAVAAVAAGGGAVSLSFCAPPLTSRLNSVSVSSQCNAMQCNVGGLDGLEGHLLCVDWLWFAHDQGGALRTRPCLPATRQPAGLPTCLPASLSVLRD